MGVERGTGRQISHGLRGEQVGGSAAAGECWGKVEEEETCSAPKKRGTGSKASRDERQTGFKLT